MTQTTIPTIACLLLGMSRVNYSGPCNLSSVEHVLLFVIYFLKISLIYKV